MNLHTNLDLTYFLAPMPRSALGRVAFSVLSRSYAPSRFRPRGFFGTSTLLCPASLSAAWLFQPFLAPTPRSVFGRVAFSAFSPLLCPAPFSGAWLFQHFSSPTPHHTLSSRGFFRRFLLPRHATLFHRVAFSAFSRSYAPLRFCRVAFSALSLSYAPPTFPRAWLFARFSSPESPK